MGPNPVYAQDFRLPEPGQMVALSLAFKPAVLKGIKLDPKNPFRFHFFVDSGDSNLSQEELKNESSKLIKYFLASLTIPEKDLWVNLSPYEKDRIVPQEFGQTEMGRDLLAEDYVLKQITASLIYPESQLGKEFWQKVYAKAQAKYGTTNIPVNTFNKVWIVPEKAVVYENGGVAFVLENNLKVMLEQDYLSLKKHAGVTSEKAQAKDTNQLGSQIVREIVIPALTKEVNEGKNFSQLRQVFYSLILATWYKKKIKDSILNKVYSNHNKISGVNVSAQDKDKIYQEYLKAFKKGVYNYIKEESDPLTNQIIPRKYFSGGVNAAQISDDMAMVGLNKISFNYFEHLRNIFVIDGTAKLNSSQVMSARPVKPPVLSQKLADGAMNTKDDIEIEPGSFINVKDLFVSTGFKGTEEERLSKIKNIDSLMDRYIKERGILTWGNPHTEKESTVIQVDVHRLKRYGLRFDEIRTIVFRNMIPWFAYYVPSHNLLVMGEPKDEIFKSFSLLRGDEVEQILPGKHFDNKEPPSFWKNWSSPGDIGDKAYQDYRKKIHPRIVKIVEAAVQHVSRYSRQIEILDIFGGDGGFLHDLSDNLKAEGVHDVSYSLLEENPKSVATAEVLFQKNPQDLLIIEISDEFYWDYEDSLPWDDPDALWDDPDALWDEEE